MTTTHTEVLTTWTADTCVPFEEKIDVDALTHLLTLTDDLAKDDIAKLKLIKRSLTRGCWLPTMYKLGKQMKSADEFLGRLTVVKGLGLQALNRDLRGALGMANYWDVDMVNAHPTMMLQLCEKKGLVCTEQSKFIEKRKDYTDAVCEALLCDREFAKKRINALYFGYASASSDLPEMFAPLHAEILRARETIVGSAEWMPHLKFLNGRDNRMGAGLSFILQTIERSCLISMEKSAKKNRRSLDVLIHDGGLIRKDEGEAAFPDTLLRAFEKDVLQDTGFRIALAVKPMETSFAVSEKGESYADMKARFEKEVFRVMNPVGFVRIHDKKIQEINLTDLLIAYSEWKVDGEAFIPLWRQDRRMKTYERFVFAPKQEVPIEEFNTFLGFPYDAVEGDVSIFIQLISLVCNHEQRCIDYLLNYLAHTIQRPYDKPGVAVVVSGLKGSGKDTPFDFMGDLLGSMFHNTFNPENTIWGRFNGDMEHNLMAKIEEASLSMTKEVEEKLKSVITAPKHTFEKKGKDVGCSKPSYTRLIFTTNNDVPIRITDDERRFFMIRSSPEKRGDVAFWTSVRSWWAKDENRAAVMWMLESRDISAFDPRTYPKTDYYAEVLSSFIPYHATYLQRWIETNEEVETFSKKPRDFLNGINGMTCVKYPMTDKGFATTMAEHYPFERKIHVGVKYYEIKVSDLKAHLKAKGWWIEM